MVVFHGEEDGGGRVRGVVCCLRRWCLLKILILVQPLVCNGTDGACLLSSSIKV